MALWPELLFVPEGDAEVWVRPAAEGRGCLGRRSHRRWYFSVSQLPSSARTVRILDGNSHLSFKRGVVFIKEKLSIRASLVAQSVKNLPAMQETCIQFLGQKIP